MSDDSGNGGNPFGDMPFFGDFSNMANMFGGGGDPWAQAKQIAASVATGGESEANVDPGDRIAYEQLARVAELHVSTATGGPLSEGAPPQIRPATRHEWALATLEAYRPMLQAMADTMSQTMSGMGEGLLPSDGSDIPGMPGGMFSGDFMAQIMKMLAPMMLSMTAGSMAGQLARTSLGSYDLPIPRPEATELIVVHANIESFTEEWSVPTDDVRLWVCLHEYLHHSVLRRPHVAERINELITRYVSAFESNTDALGSQFGGIDPSNPESMGQLEGLMNDPEALMGVVQSDAQRAMLPEISALMSAIVGYVDHMMDAIGANLIGSYSMISEALHRRRVTADPTDRFLQRMLGLELDQACYEQGRSFVDGVVERGGDAALARLWESARELPTPNEIVAPGLWLARIDIDDLGIDAVASDEEE